MKHLKIFLLIIVAVGLAAGCSDKQKEAARLEAEMENLDTEHDTASETLKGLEEESMEMSSTVADAATAIPTEADVASGFTEPVPEGDGYTIQVASCEDADYANHLVSLYKQRGYRPFVVTYTHDGQTYYRVRIGSFGSHSEAAEVKLELEDKYSVQPWIDQHTQ